ncbi:response regulator [Rhodoblastus sp.]|uniref:response regulator n=1 Tax=Rhodoblastus sp. TaxID=1962975 RepID=UPI003F9AEFDB
MNNAAADKREHYDVPVIGPPFLAGGGEMGARLRAFDWESTSLGPPETWPQSLKTSVRIMLTSRQPIWIGWGPDLLFFYNDPYKAIIGGKHPHSLGLPTRVVWHEIWNDIAPMLSQATTGGEGTYIESHLLVMERNGYPEETYYTFSYSPIPDDKDNAGGIICANTDDTQRVISERQLALLRDLSAGTADVRTTDEACRRAALALATDPQDIPFAMIYLAEGGETAAALKEVCGIERGHPATPDFLVGGPSAWPSPECLGDGDQVVELAAHFDARFPAGPWDKAPVRAAALALSATGDSGCNGVLVVGLNPFRLYDDKYRSFLRLVAGQITAAIANAEAYQNERRKVEALAEIDRAKTAFFSNISHEFRTPLTLMLGPLEDRLGKAAKQPGEDSEWMRIVHRNGLRLLRLVNTLLDFSRLEAGRAQAVFRPVDLSAMTAELASNFRAATDKAGLALVVDCPPLAEPVFVDSESWEKIVLNLLSNAFKFTLQGQIAVSLRLVGRNAELAVCDTGIGIPEAEIPRLFERFHRVANAGGRSHEGSGIGLSLVQELTRLHGGTVRVESGANKGSCFYVSIPLGTTHLPAELVRSAPNSPPHPVQADTFLEEALRWLPTALPDDIDLDAELTRPAATDARPRVVLADDNADMRDYVQRLLADRYVVEVVADGEEALGAIRARRPDLVLTDVMMPRLDGLGLLQAIRADPGMRDLPVILLSARAGEDAEVQGRTAGADDYLIKPFSARELVARIGAALKLAQVRRGAAEAIRESEARLRALVEATSQVTYRMSPDWAEMRELDGPNLTDARIPKADWLKHNIHHDDFSSVWSDIQEAIRTRSVFDREYRVRLADGSWGWTHSRAVPLLDPNGEIYEWFGAAADVTARRTAQEELSKLNAELEHRVDLAAAQLVQLQKMESIGQLTGGIAHDFNNLLMAILTSLEIVKSHLQGGDLRQFMLIDNAIQAAQRGANLTQRMLAFARKQELKPEPVSLPELVLGMADLLVSSLGPHIRIETRHAFGTSKALVDSNQMEMAILNLAVNARDAMPEGGVLTISSDEVAIVPGGQMAPGRYVRLMVTDSGTGMNAETLRRATEPFFTTKGAGKGTGLGLSMVHGLAAQSGGRFDLHSAPGQGTTAEILLPVSTAAEEAAIPATSGQSPPGPSGKRELTVLAVDDDPLVLMGMVLVLEEQGHEAVQAYSGRKALDLLESGVAVDVVVTDQIMPGMTGVQLAETIQSRWPHLPVILATGYGELPAGARTTRRLRKPFSPEQLSAALAEVTGPANRDARASPAP